MDPSLKKRLIGAAILVVIAAVFLPMFLSGPPARQSIGQTLPLDIPPPPERDLSQVTLPLGEIDGAERDTVVAVDTAPDVPAPVASSREADEPAVADTASSEPAPAASVPPASPSVPPTATQGSEGRYWVGLGSYGQSANADRVVAAATAKGVAVDRETLQRDGRELIRLRAGPWTTRAQAEQARQLLIAAVPDARPKIEESDAALTADVPAPGAAAAAGAWVVQVGAFGEQDNARQLRDRLRSAGYPCFVERRGQSFAVRVGPYVRRTEAEAQRQRLKTSHQLDGLVVGHSG